MKSKAAKILTHLVLDVDTGSASLNHHFRELHHGSQTSMTSVGIGHDWSEVVDGGRQVSPFACGRR